MSLSTFRKLQDEHNAMVDYVRSLRPLGSNTEGLVHTALGVRREGGGRAPAATGGDGYWR